MTKLGWQEIENVRGRVGCAFKALRALGFIARQNFLCCGGCASSQIASDFGAMPKSKQNKVRGAVFFHRQDRERLDDGGALFIRFGAIDTECKCGQENPHRASTADLSGMSTADVGDAVRIALEAEGLKVEWDGDPDKCIEVVGCAPAPIPMAVGL